MKFYIIISMFLIGTCQAETPDRFCSIRDVLGFSRVTPLLQDVVTAIQKKSGTDISRLSRELVVEQSKFLKQNGVTFRINSKEEWIDILPNSKGQPLNRIAYQLGNEKTSKHLLRYHPAMLFEDAASAFDTFIDQNRAIYLTHQDLLKGPHSDFYQKQIHFKENSQAAYAQRIKQTKSDLELQKVFIQMQSQHKKPITLTDYEKDWTVSDFSPSSEIETTLSAYLKKTPPVSFLQNPSDPIVIKISPSRRMFREYYNVPLKDISGTTKTLKTINGFRVSELSGPSGEAEKSVYDLFLTDAVRDRHYEGSYRRALILPDGRTLAHLNGTKETKPYFESYLDFLETIYRDPKGLNLTKKTFDALRETSLKYSDRSELIVRAKNPRWLEKPTGEDVNGGLILVKSENPAQKLPMHEAHTGLKIKHPENEVWIEAGRLGSLTGEETIQFLKVASTSLHFQYQEKVVRIFCEANQTRAKLFKRFGFTEAPVQLPPSPYYPDGTDFILQVTLEDFMKSVLK